MAPLLACGSASFLWYASEAVYIHHTWSWHLLGCVHLCFSSDLLFLCPYAVRCSLLESPSHAQWVPLLSALLWAWGWPTQPNPHSFAETVPERALFHFSPPFSEPLNPYSPLHLTWPPVTFYHSLRVFGKFPHLWLLHMLQMKSVLLETGEGVSLRSVSPPR